MEFASPLTYVITGFKCTLSTLQYNTLGYRESDANPNQNNLESLHYAEIAGKKSLIDYQSDWIYVL